MTVILLAIVVGIISGLMPGIGLGIVIISLYPLLSHMDLVSIFLFYIVADNTTQYYGSVSSIVFGVMGETTSAPAVNNGHELFRQGHGADALAYTATSSFIASIFGIFVFWLCAIYSPLLITLLSGKIKAFILLVTLGVLVYISSNRLLGFLLAIMGLVFGSAGSDIVTLAHYVFPQYSAFDGGIPFAPLLIGFMVVPTLWHYTQNKIQTDYHIEPITMRDRFTKLFKLEHFASTVRGSVIGSFCGAIPGVSYSISSNLAEAVEKSVNKDKPSLMKNLLSAEAANNAGAVVVLAPLMLFAVPILPSEALILGLAETKGFTYQSGLLTEHLYMMLMIMFCVNVVNWLVSGYCYRYVTKIYSAMSKYGYSVILAGCIGLVLALGYYEYRLALTVYTLVLASIAGFIVRDVANKMPFVFGFFIAAELLPELYRLYLVY